MAEYGGASSQSILITPVLSIATPKSLVLDSQDSLAHFPAARHHGGAPAVDHKVLTNWMTLLRPERWSDSSTVLPLTDVRLPGGIPHAGSRFM